MGDGICLERTDKTEKMVEGISAGAIAKGMILKLVEGDRFLSVEAGCKPLGDVSDTGAGGGGRVGSSGIVCISASISLAETCSDCSFASCNSLIVSSRLILDNEALRERDWLLVEVRFGSVLFMRELKSSSGRDFRRPKLSRAGRRSRLGGSFKLTDMDRENFWTGGDVGVIIGALIVMMEDDEEWLTELLLRCDKRLGRRVSESDFRMAPTTPSLGLVEPAVLGLDDSSVNSSVSVGCFEVRGVDIVADRCAGFSVSSYITLPDTGDRGLPLGYLEDGRANGDRGCCIPCPDRS